MADQPAYLNPDGSVKRWWEMGNSTPQQDFRGQLDQNAQQQAAYGQQGQYGFAQTMAENRGDRQNLRDIASGKNSYSAEALRQGLMQNQNAQRSMAANANPRDAAMAAMRGQSVAGQQGAGLSGQAAQLGIQERNQAAMALSQAGGQAAGQYNQAALGGAQNAINANSAGYNYQNQYDIAKMGQPSAQDKLMAGGVALGQAGILASDRNIKSNVSDGSKKADALLEGLKAYSYTYNDPKHGAGEQLGIMAQDLEKAGLGQAVIDTPEGKGVDTVKLTGALAAGLASMHGRLKKVESGGR